MAGFEDFFRPESMVTPGVAGGMVMAITNTLWLHFGLEPRWSGLGLSFLLGTVVFVAGSLPVWKRGVLYVLNSLIIFSVAAGANYAGVMASGASGEPTAKPSARISQRLEMAPADVTTSGKLLLKSRSAAPSAPETGSKRAGRTQEEAGKKEPTSPPPTSERFFRPW